MRNFSDPGRRLFRRRDRLQVAVVINQLATPGLGSWMAGHRYAGAGQLALAIAGFVLFVGYCVLLVVEAWKASEADVGLVLPSPLWWQQGLALFGAAWLWAGVTSIQMLVELRRWKGTPGEPPRLG